MAFKLVSAITTGDTDTSRDYVYTDWEAVETFALEFVRFVEGEARPAARMTNGEESAAEGGRGEDERGVTRVALRVGLVLGIVGVVYWLVRARASRSPGHRSEEMLEETDHGNIYQY